MVCSALCIVAISRYACDEEDSDFRDAYAKMDLLVLNHHKALCCCDCGGIRCNPLARTTWNLFGATFGGKIIPHEVFFLRKL